MIVYGYVYVCMYIRTIQSIYGLFKLTPKSWDYFAHHYHYHHHHIIKMRLRRKYRDNGNVTLI